MIKMGPLLLNQCSRFSGMNGIKNRKVDRRERYWFPECGFYAAGVEDKKGGWGASLARSKELEPISRKTGKICKVNLIVSVDICTLAMLAEVATDNKPILGKN